MSLINLLTKIKITECVITVRDFNDSTAFVTTTWKVKRLFKSGTAVLLEDAVWGPPPEYKSRTILTQVSYDISKIVAE